MAAITVQDITADIRVMSGLRNNQLFSDIQIQSLVQDAGNELYDIIEGSFEHYAISTLDFTIASGASSVDLPEDFKRDNSLTRNPTSSSPETVDVLGSWLERNNQGNTSLTGDRKYFITGSELEIFPSSSAPGDYRLFYTPFFTFTGFDPTVDTDFTVDVYAPENLSLVTFGAPGPGRSFTVSPNPGSQLTLNGVPLIGAPTPAAGATTILIANQSTQSQNGLFRCAESDPGGTVFYRLEGYDQTSELAVGTTVLVTGGTVGAGAYTQTSTQLNIDVGPLIWDAIPALAVPVNMTPWVLYLKVHASIAIRTSRQQDSADLQAKLQQLKGRIEKSVKNRTEAPKQAPITRHRWRGQGRGW